VSISDIKTFIKQLVLFVCPYELEFPRWSPTRASTVFEPARGSMTDRPLLVKFVINNDNLIKPYPQPCKAKQNASLHNLSDLFFCNWRYLSALKHSLLRISLCVITGLSLRAGSREFCPATTSLGTGYFDTKRKYCKEKNVSNYKIMN